MALHYLNHTQERLILTCDLIVTHVWFIYETIFQAHILAKICNNTQFCRCCDFRIDILASERRQAQNTFIYFLAQVWQPIHRYFEHFPGRGPLMCTRWTDDARGDHVLSDISLMLLYHTHIGTGMRFFESPSGFTNSRHHILPIRNHNG